MSLKEADFFSFKDLGTDAEGLASIRFDEDLVAIGFTLKAGGDIDVAMSKEDAAKLRDALNQALQ